MTITTVDENTCKQAEGLAKLAILHGIKDSEDGETVLSQDVEDSKAQEARTINRRGLAAQIEYILEFMGSHPERRANALELVENVIKDNADGSGPGMVECIERDCREREFKELSTPYGDGHRCRKCAEKARKERGGK
jgi:hypothetical protein